MSDDKQNNTEEEQARAKQSVGGAASDGGSTKNDSEEVPRSAQDGEAAKQNLSEIYSNVTIDSNGDRQSDNEMHENSDGDDNASTDAQSIFNQSAAAEIAVEQVLSAKRQKNTVGWLALLLAVLALAGGACLAWYGYQYQTQFTNTELLVRQALNQVAEIDVAQQQAERSFAQQLKAQQTYDANFEQAISEASARLDGQARRLLSLTATTTDDWRIAEVEYLLRLANQRLIMAKDTASALELLAGSDQILLELDDPRLFALRKVIASDKAAISAVAKQDVDGIYLSLAALSQQIKTLPLDNRPKLVVVGEDGLSDSDDLSGEVLDSSAGTSKWRKIFVEIVQSTWQEVKSVVTVQKLQVDVKPLLPPEQQYYLRGNLQLLINQAQIALLDRRDVIYQKSLIAASQWLEEYFSANHTATDSIQVELARLAAIKINPGYPDLRESLLAVKAFINEQHAQLSEVSNDSQVKEAK